ncbi:putative E3 ubiquitin-protein ligase makorin-2 [Toxocara canis]|uniref:RING-type E3 ubiquitin transferase n=1 Tax=Toxocara canis TaxID=6265 RepID=A0A0B2VN00_TOXCA|nr:putative E3 ubiquitin-protein ligase makorin-2 [Toxocara canis]
MANNSGTGRAGPSSSAVLCRYFANNVCNKGAQCPFSHDRTAKPDYVCRFYLAGKCAYGSACRYDHKRPSSDWCNKSMGERPKVQKESDTKKPSETSSTVSSFSSRKLSASAAEFIPSWMKAPQSENTYASVSGSVAVLPLCPYFETGHCEKGDECEFVHGLVCDMCNVACLHPGDSEQRAQHRRECLAAHEAAMEEAFAEARSADKVCGICMENIRERNARFGILEGCRHCFCLDCIRQWRRNQNQQFEKETVRSCPECRTHSDFVIPAMYWVEDADDKKKLIDEFRANTKQKQCKYIKNGNLDDCPFGNKCFYKHQMPDGTIAEGKSPRALRRSAPRRRRRPLMFDLLSQDYASAFLLSSDSDSDDEFSFFFNSVLPHAFSLL